MILKLCLNLRSNHLNTEGVKTLFILNNGGVKMNDRQLVFYDIEIYKEDAFVVFKTIDKNMVGFFHNHFEGLKEFISDKTLVGFNNYYYDDKMLTKMIEQWSPQQLKTLNDEIIGNRDYKMKISPYIDSLDVYQEISTSRPGLKKIEGNMGKMILESSVPFDIDRKLTRIELNDSIEYCKYDVDMTIEIYIMRERSYFTAKSRLLERLGDDRAKRWNTTTISANLLIDKPLTKWSSLRVEERLLDIVPVEVREMWEQINNISMKIKVKRATVDEFDNQIVFAFGGLHGRNMVKSRHSDVLLLDVTSMYPNIIIALGILGIYTKGYEEILAERVKVKHVDKPLSDALKLVLNSVSGNLESKYSKLHNPRAAHTLRITGQILIYDLFLRLAPFVTVVNVNTDGVMFTTNNDSYKRVWQDWQDEYGLNLELEKYKTIIQRDVNNYIAVKENNKVKAIGDLKRYGGDKPFENNNTRIVDIAIVDYLLYDKPILTTLQERMDEPKLFQYILQAGGTYQGTYDREGKKYNKVNRIFASKKKGFAVFKRRQDGGLVRFPDAPLDMLIWNDDVDKLTNFRDVVDINFYYKLIQRKLERWG